MPSVQATIWATGLHYRLAVPVGHTQGSLWIAGHAIVGAHCAVDIGASRFGSTSDFLFDFNIRRRDDRPLED